MYTFHELALASGSIARLGDFHVRRTYADLLEGTPDAEYNNKIMTRASIAMEKIWGKRKTHLIAPEIRIITEAGRTFPRLPELTYYAWLTSDPIESPWCASELVVIWFGPYDLENSVPALVQRAIRDLPWERLAQDFDY